MVDRVVCAAIRHRESGDLILGPRHFDATMHAQIKNYKLIHVNWRSAEQGFVNQRGEFLTRSEAYYVALRADQIIKEVGGNDREILFSENLY